MGADLGNDATNVLVGATKPTASQARTRLVLSHGGGFGFAGGEY